MNKYNYGDHKTREQVGRHIINSKINGPIESSKEVADWLNFYIGGVYPTKSKMYQSLSISI